MKKLLLIFLLLFSVNSFGQSISNLDTKSSGVRSVGFLISDSMHNQKYFDTTTCKLAFWSNAALRTGRIARQNSRIYIYNGSYFELLDNVQGVDTSSLSNRINLKVGYADTLAMLLPYATKTKVLADSIALAAQTNTRVKYTDTAAMLTNYVVNGVNGITKTGKSLGLGGSLTGATTITTTGSNTLALAGLQSGGGNDSVVTVNPSTGVLARRAFPSGGGGSISYTSPTLNFIPKVTNTTGPVLGNSLITDDGTTQGINTASSNASLQVGSMTVSAVSNPSLIHQGGAYGGNVGGLRSEYKHILFQNPTSLDVVAGAGFDGLGNLWYGYPFSMTWYGGLSNPKVLAATLTADGTYSSNNLAWAGATPSIVAGAGAGTTPTISISGTNGDYQVTLTAGTTPTGSAVIFTVTMASSFASSATMFPVFSAANITAASLSGTTYPYITGTTTTHVLNANTVGLVGGSTYVWNISCNPKK